MTIGRNAQFANEHLDVRTRSGVEWLALCPYHDDRSPSFSFNIHKGLFICYACGAKGNIKQLAQHLGVAKKDDEIGAVDISADDVKQKIQSVFQNRNEIVEDNPRTERNVVMSRLGDEFIQQWAKRGITNPEVLDAFQLGYSSMRDALTIPIFTDVGKVREMIFRNLSTEPKYQYPANFKISTHLYGFWQATCLSMGQRIKALAVTEGSIDTLSLWEVGIPSVALLGARASNAHLMRLRELDPRIVVVMTDMDTAGATASMEVTSALSRTGIIVVRASWPREEAKDPAELSPERRIEVFQRELDIS